MKSILLVITMFVSILNFAANNEKNPVLISKIGAWTTSALVYPKNAAAEKKEGIVYVSFQITKSQEIIRVEIEEGVSPDLNQKAIEIVSNLNVDKDLFQIGKKYILPVKFAIK